MISVFSIAILVAKKQESNTFKFLRENYFSSSILYPAKLSTKGEGIKTISEMQGLKNFTSQVPFLRQLLKDVCHQCEEVNQERRSNELQKTGEPTQERSKGNFQDDGEGKLQNDSCEAGLEIIKFKL